MSSQKRKKKPFYVKISFSIYFADYFLRRDFLIFSKNNFFTFKSKLWIFGPFGHHSSELWSSNWTSFVLFLIQWKMCYCKWFKWYLKISIYSFITGIVSLGLHKMGKVEIVDGLWIEWKSLETNIARNWNKNKEN